MNSWEVWAVKDFLALKPWETLMQSQVGYTAAFLGYPQGVDDLPQWFPISKISVADAKRHDVSKGETPTWRWWNTVIPPWFTMIHPIILLVKQYIIHQPYCWRILPSRRSIWGWWCSPHCLNQGPWTDICVSQQAFGTVYVCALSAPKGWGARRSIHYTSIHLSICLSVCLFVCLSVCVSNLIQSNLI